MLYFGNIRISRRNKIRLNIKYYLSSWKRCTLRRANRERFKTKMVTSRRPVNVVRSKTSIFRKSMLWCCKTKRLLIYVLMLDYSLPMWSSNLCHLKMGINQQTTYLPTYLQTWILPNQRPDTPQTPWILFV